MTEKSRQRSSCCSRKASKPGLLSAVAGHGVTGIAEPSLQERLDDGLQPAAGEAGNPDAAAHQGSFQAAGNRPAHKHLHAEAGDCLRPREGIAAVQPGCFPPNHPAVFDIDEHQVVRHVENGRHPAHPARNGDLHAYPAEQAPCQGHLPAISAWGYAFGCRAR
jgi:hypothetical protein